MVNYKEILRLSYEKELSGRQIAASLGCSKTVVNEFLRRFRSSGHSYPLEDGVTNESLRNELYQPSGAEYLSRIPGDYLEPDYEGIRDALKVKGMTMKRQWYLHRLKAQQSGGKRPYSYRQFCAKYAEWRGRNDLTARLGHSPGERMEVDFAGKQPRLTDRYTGGRGAKVTVFVAVLPYSQMFYAEGLAKCDSANWIQAHNNALGFFGGVPGIVTCDNCKVAVSRNLDWKDPEINRDYQEWAAHNGTAIMPANNYSPTWKASVERTVRIVTEDILVPMDEVEIFSLEEFNEILWEKLEERLCRPGRDGRSRREVFTEEELQCLAPLPETRYEFMKRRTAKVSREQTYVFDGVSYTLPAKYVGKRIDIRATAAVLYIHDNISGDLIREQPRSYDRSRPVIEPSDLPWKYREYGRWSMEYFQQKASGIGPSARLVIDRLFGEAAAPAQVYRKSLAILVDFAEEHGTAAVEECCRRALREDKVSYAHIKNTIAQVGEETARQAGPGTPAAYKADDGRYTLSRLAADDGASESKDGNDV